MKFILNFIVNVYTKRDRFLWLRFTDGSNTGWQNIAKFSDIIRALLAVKIVHSCDVNCCSLEIQKYVTIFTQTPRSRDRWVNALSEEILKVFKNSKFDDFNVMALLTTYFIHCDFLFRLLPNQERKAVTNAGTRVSRVSFSLMYQYCDIYIDVAECFSWCKVTPQVCSAC